MFFCYNCFDFYFAKDDIMYTFAILSATSNVTFHNFFEKFFSKEDISYKWIYNVTNEEYFLSKTMQFFPDIFLLDADFPCSDIFSLIDQLQAQLDNPKIILIVSNPTNHLLLEAIHRHVLDIITAPLTEQDFHQTLQRSLIHLNQMYGNNNSSVEINSASRRLFIYKDAYDEQVQNLPLSQINSLYGTFFKVGIFRGLMIKMDNPSNIMSIFENNWLRDKIIRILKKHLAPICNDIIVDKLSDGVYFLLNYPDFQHENVNHETQEMFSEIKKILQHIYGIIVTMCISKEYTDLYHLQNIKKEVFDTRFFRIHYGTNKVLSVDHEKQTHIMPQQEADLRVHYDAIVQAFRSLDIPNSMNKLNLFFIYAKDNNIVYTSEIRLYIRYLIDSLFDLYTKEINKYTSASELKHLFIYRVNMAYSFERIQSTFIEVVPEILKNVSAVIEQDRHCKPVTDTLFYIQKNYSKEISLNQLADLTGLTPSYFSALFKKEMGITISNYLINYRLDIAQNKLQTTQLPISEIADAVGYPDVKYFSRIFKKKTNLTPSKFRQLMYQG